MPLSKPVKKQQLLLPSPKDFHLLAKDKKENILKRLSTDNLIIYLEYIVASFHTPTKAECFTLEQIVEDDVRLGSNYSDEETFISSWIAKNANRSPDIEANLLDQNGNYAMTSTKTITQTLLGVSSTPMAEPKNESPLGKSIFQDVSNFPSSINSNLAGVSKMSAESLYSGPSYTSSPLMSRSTRVKNAWENVLQPSSQTSRWQSSASLGKENTPQFKSAIERPPSGLDLRYGNESPLKETFAFSKATNYGSGGSKPSLTPSYHQELPIAPPISANYSQFGMKQMDGGNIFDPPLETSDEFAGTSFTGPLRTERGNEFGSSMLSSTKLDGNYYGSKNLNLDTFSSFDFDPIFGKSPSKPPSSVSPTDYFNGPVKSALKNPMKNLDDAFSNAAVDVAPSAIAMPPETSGPDLLAGFSLPEPNVFNEMSADARSKILNSLPRAAKNKYEYYCWSFKLNQLFRERPNFSD